VYRHTVFDFKQATITVRPDIGAVYNRFWRHLANPGGSLTGGQRVSVAAVARGGIAEADGLPLEISQLARHLMHDPATVGSENVRSAADAAGEAATVETIAIISQLSAVDSFHAALGIPTESLPSPVDGAATGDVVEGLKRRRTHVPMPAGPIPVALDLVPAEGRMLEALAGPQYMTYDEMALNDFRRTPGLDRSQMELISSRESFHNECFY